MSLIIVSIAAALIGGLALATAIGVRLIERAHPPAGRLVAVTGGRLHVVELTPAASARGPAIVLLHGASGNLEDMRMGLGARLARSHRVILIDRPGHGWSDRPGGNADASPARQAALVREALDALGMERAILVGHSLAGAVVTAFALAYPERVSGLVLVAPVTHRWPGGISWHYTVATTPIVGPLFARTMAVPIGALLLEPGAREVFAPQAPPTDYVSRAAIALVLRPSQFLANARDVKELKGFVAAQALRYGEIKAPTVIITGDQDNTVSRKIHSEAVAAAIPKAELIVLPGIGHMPHHAAVDAVVAAIERLAAQAPPIPAAR